MLDTRIWTRKTRSSGWIAVLAGLALLGCGVDGELGEEADLEASSSSQLDNDVILDWNEIAFTAGAIAGYPGLLLFTHDRGVTMMHIAQHDALNAIRDRYDHYAFNGNDRNANPIAAAAQAARDVMVHIYPAQTALFDTELARWLGTVPGGSAKTKGIALGRASAAAIIAERTGDGIDIFGTYTPGTGPGKYQFTPGFPFVLQPALVDVPPFSLDEADQFRSPPRPSLTSSKYTTDFNEVKSVGVVNSATRTQDQSEYAAFWFEPSDSGWNRIARITAEEEDLGLWRTARLFALNNMVLLDGYISGWESKLHYDFWRPITAIHAADTDGNPQTAPDAAWDSFQVAPPIQDYPSTHSILGKASSVVLAESFLTDRVTFDFTSPTALPGTGPRRYTSFAFAASQNADSRVRAGIHFRFSCNAGLAMGTQIGVHAIFKKLRPRGHVSIHE